MLDYISPTAIDNAPSDTNALQIHHRFKSQVPVQSPRPIVVLQSLWVASRYRSRRKTGRPSVAFILRSDGLALARPAAAATPTAAAAPPPGPRSTCAVYFVACVRWHSQFFDESPVNKAIVGATQPPPVDSTMSPSCNTITLPALPEVSFRCDPLRIARDRGAEGGEFQACETVHGALIVDFSLGRRREGESALLTSSSRPLL